MWRLSSNCLDKMKRKKSFAREKETYSLSLLYLELVPGTSTMKTVVKNIYFHGCKEYLTKIVNPYMNNKMRRI